MIKPDFTSMDTLDDVIWCVMCDQQMSMPVQLIDADLSIPFIYDRRYGVFPVSNGHHQNAMATILAWDNGGKEVFKN
jgi:hypothetical protein